jgi:hypothetical protein
MYRTVQHDSGSSFLRHTRCFYVHSLLIEGTVVFVTHVNCVNIFRLRVFTTTDVGIVTAYGLDGPGIESRWG